MKKAPLVIAHRGFSADAPENTLAAFERAVRGGADGIELDVWRCASGEIVVTHNEDVKILTGHPGSVESMTYSDLRKLDFGIHKGSQFQGEKIPLLNEVLDLAKDLPLVNIEIKGRHWISNGIEAELGKILEQRKNLDQVIVSSFNPLTLARIKRRNPLIRLGLLFFEGSSLPFRKAWPAGWLRPFSLHPSLLLLTPLLTQRAQGKNRKIIVWTVNQINELEKCIRCQVDGIITDNPVWLRENLKQG